MPSKADDRSNPPAEPVDRPATLEEIVEIRVNHQLIASCLPFQLSRIIRDKTGVLRMYLSMFPTIAGLVTRSAVTGQLALLEWCTAPTSTSFDLSRMTEEAVTGVVEILRCGPDHTRSSILIRRLMLDLDTIHRGRSVTCLDPKLLITPLAGAGPELTEIWRMMQEILLKPAGGSAWRAINELAEPDGFWVIAMIRALEAMITEPEKVTAEQRSQPLVQRLLRWIDERSAAEKEALGDFLSGVIIYAEKLAELRSSGIIVVDALKSGCIPECGSD